MTKREVTFVKRVTEFYKIHGRHDLPWRQTTNPYLILVSEIMLQQTQVERVIPKYLAFSKAYPSSLKLAKASLRDVLVLWQGLGYNRRAKALVDAARHISGHFSGVFPRTREDILSLPGVGPYTTGAILAFAFNKGVPIIETNIRTVYLHHFFSKKKEVSDKELLSIINLTLDTKNPRMWYYALMDYGSYLKKTVPNPNKRSVHHSVQTTFAGSNRQIRGAIIRVLGEQLESQTSTALEKLLSTHEVLRIREQLEALVQEDLVTKQGRRYYLPT